MTSSGQIVSDSDRILIRPECESDIDSIADVITRAFAVAEHASGTEAQIVEKLRSRGRLSVSLVAEFEGTVVGHIAASPVSISNHAEGCWYGLGPVAVSPELHGKGIGGRLIRETFARLTELGADGCVVLGESAYYGRFGFRVYDSLRLPGLPPEYFMAIVLRGNGKIPEGSVSYDEAFESDTGSS
jgi:predicted N-acetyltransferase YhbS